jgi:hypothetical protein
MKNPNCMERAELIAEVAQLRERMTRSAPVIEAAVTLRVADRRRDDARIDAATAELCDAVDELIVGTIAHATAVRLGVADTGRSS